MSDPDPKQSVSRERMTARRRRVLETSFAAIISEIQKHDDAHAISDDLWQAHDDLWFACFGPWCDLCQSEHFSGQPHGPNYEPLP